MNITKVLVWKVRFFFFLCLFLCSSHLKIVARLSCWVDIFYIKWFIPGEMSERCGKWTPCCQWLGRNRMNVLLKWAEKPMSQDFSRNIFFISVSVVTPRVFALWCFYGDELFSLLSSSFSVIQPPLPLPIDKVRTEVCMCVRVFVSVVLSHVKVSLTHSHVGLHLREASKSVCLYF